MTFLTLSSIFSTKTIFIKLIFKFKKLGSYNSDHQELSNRKSGILWSKSLPKWFKTIDLKKNPSNLKSTTSGTFFYKKMLLENKILLEKKIF